MIDYLKNYNISDEQINFIENLIKNNELISDTMEFENEKVMSILNLFVSIGVHNIYAIIVANPLMFCDTIASIKKKLERYEDKSELARLLDENAENLTLIGLL